MIQKNIFMLANSTTQEEIGKYKTIEYTANIKYDGERILAIKTSGEVILFNRLGRICNKQFREVAEELKEIKGDFIIDGEIISKDDNFSKLQKRALTSKKHLIKELTKSVPVKYMIFDILQREKKDLRDFNLVDRLEDLEKIRVELIKTTFNFVELAEYNSVDIMYNKARAEDREGIMIKNLYGHYESGKRSDDWLKLKFWEEGTLEAIKYEVNMTGIRVEDKDGNAVQIQGQQSKEVKDLIDKDGKALIEIQFLERTAKGRYRFPSYRGLVKQGISDSQNKGGSIF